MQITVPSLLRIKPKAISKIGKYLAQKKCLQIALFWGEGIQELLGETVKISLENSEINIISEKVWASGHLEDIFEQSLELAGSKTKAILAIGGGKVIDCCKYMAFSNQIPLFTAPTAISNDGFCSPMSSLLVKGKKRSLKTTLPQGVIIDTEIIQKAPPKFFFSGIGDLISKHTSIFDWKLSFKRTGEYVDDFAVMVSFNALENCVNYPDKDLNNLEYLQIVASSLLLSGVAMEIAGSSRPASGSEHLISHAYDQIAQTPSMHGLQVGVASYAISYLQEQTFHKVEKDLQRTGFFSFMQTNPLNKQEFLEAIKLAPSLKENFYTILSEKNNISKLLQFVQEDEFINQMLK